ncbi:V-type ATPase subunit [Candidatus Micrarchaeota archaeon]|nr:V-type ATPase subunit [Candidatus Micrarchaeota archaeon]
MSGYTVTGWTDIKSLLGKIKPQSKALKYGYSNARIRGMSGLLLGESFLYELVSVGTVDSMIELLQRTGYKNDLNLASSSEVGSGIVELAVSRNFSRTIQKIIKLTPKSDLSTVRALLLRWDLLNLKLIMDARRANRPYDSIKSGLFAVGCLSDSDFKRILTADDRDLRRELRRTVLGEILFASPNSSDLSSAFESTNAFFSAPVDELFSSVVDDALSKISSKEVRSLRSLLKYEIDAKNILIIQRLKQKKSSSASALDRKAVLPSLIAGGTLSDSLISRLIEAKDLSSVESLIKNRFPSFSLQENTLIGLEIALEKSIATQKVYSFHRYVLSIGVIVGFLLLKEEELNNLRKIAKAKEFNISQEDVKKMLVVV